LYGVLTASAQVRLVFSSRSGGAQDRSQTIEDDGPGPHADTEKRLERIALEKAHVRYAHKHGEDSGDAYQKRTIMGREAVIAVTPEEAQCRPVAADFLRRD
jgi:thiamine phosphate synthase YjbQ (UPF0047 family)